MKWKSVKSEKEISLKGVKIELIFQDKTLKGAIIRQGSEMVKFTQQDYSSFAIFVPEPEKTFTVTAEIHGMAFKASFETEEEAKDKLRELEREGVSDPVLEGIETVRFTDEIPF